MEAPPEGYRRNAGICLINSSNKIFAASWLGRPNVWQMPQGGINEDEDPKDAAIRELREETGITSAQIIAEYPHWLTYDFSPDPEGREIRIKNWGIDWKGQAQKWFLLKYTGEDDEINLSGDGSEKPEFGRWSWMSPEQVYDLVAGEDTVVGPILALVAHVQPICFSDLATKVLYLNIFRSLLNSSLFKRKKRQKYEEDHIAQIY